MVLVSVGVLDCHRVVESGCLAYLLTALSSIQKDVRKAASHTLGRFYSHVRASSTKEKPQARTLPTVWHEILAGVMFGGFAIFFPPKIGGL